MSGSLRSLLVLPLVALVLAGCSDPQHTVDKLETEVAAYKKSPSARKKAEIQELFGKLDQQIAEIDKKQASNPTDERARQLAQLEQSRRELNSEFQAAQLTQAVDQAKEALKGVGDSISESLRQAGDELRNALDSAETPSTNAPSPAEP